jgi:hypothetical protein
MPASPVSIVNVGYRPCPCSRPTKGKDRIDVHRAGSRNHGRGESRNGKHDTSADKRQRIGCRDAKQLRLDVPRAQERTSETDGHSDPELIAIPISY